MKRTTALLAALVILPLITVLSGCATLGTQPQIKAEVVMKQGDAVTLFHGGTREAKEEFCIGDTVPVYRGYPQKRLRYLEVGKVRLVRYLGDHYFDAVVVEGEVKVGDLARKVSAACLVTPSEPEEK